MMNYQTFPLVAVLLGVVLIISSFAWRGIRSGDSAWTAEDEAAYSAATEKWRSLGHSHGPDDKTNEAEAQRITEEFNNERDRFQSAVNRGATLATLFWWSGFLFVLGGAGGVLMQRLSDDQA